MTQKIPMPKLPKHVQTIIIGGGSIGVNTAYHLTKLGHTDVLLLERDQLTSGTTWHAAGLVVAGILTSEAECEIYTHGRKLYAELEAETGLSTGFRDVGYLQIANNAERVHELRRIAPFMPLRVWWLNPLGRRFSNVAPPSLRAPSICRIISI